MAPLKQNAYPLLNTGATKYPWLRGHGSIEAETCGGQRQHPCQYPWLRGHGSIEARQGPPLLCTGVRYPWLRGHGSIEAIVSE